MRKTIPSYTIIRDTREKEGYGWLFKEQDNRAKPPKCEGTIIQTLETGDYTVVGYEDILSIERKDDFGELWTNYAKRELFEDEMRRMMPFKYKYIIVESPITPDHFDLSPPQYKTGVPGKALIQWVIDLTNIYGVHIIYAGQCGKQYAQSIMKSVVRIEKERW